MTKASPQDGVLIDLPRPQARVGLILPASNRVCEAQFAALAPDTITFHTTRARVAGKWMRPLDELSTHIADVTSIVAEAEPDLLVYNCTASSMKEGRAGEQKILDIMGKVSNIPAISTSACVSEAFNTLSVRSTIVITPYARNDDIVSYLQECGVRTVRSIALGLPPREYGLVPPEEWYDIAKANDTAEAESIFLSCAATTQIEAIDAIERTLGKPVVNSNQAVLWGCLTRLRHSIGDARPSRPLGRLFEQPRVSGTVT